MWDSLFSSLCSKFSAKLAVLLTKPISCSTPEGRSQQRYRRAAWTTLTMIAARVTNIMTGVITVPITLKYLGEDLYGVWMALTSVVGFLSFYDFGIGTGLRNMLIECAANNDVEMPRKYIGNALLVLTAMSAVMIIFIFSVLPNFQWESLIKCSNPASVPQILPTAQAVMTMFALGIPVTQLQNIANAYQRGYWGYLCFLVGRIFGFLFVLWCVYEAKDLWLLAGGYVGIPLIITLVGWVVFFRTAPRLRPWPIFPELDIIKSLFGTGFFVLVHTLSLLLINSSPIILIANTINAASAVPYSVTQRLLGASNMISMSLMIGISVAVGEAWHQRDYNWIKKTIKRSEMIVFATGILPLLLFLFAGRKIILWWLSSPESVPSFLLLLVCVTVTCTFSIGYIYSSCLMAMNFVRYIAIVRIMASLVYLAGGYLAGILIQSPALIILCQFVFGAFFPTVLLWKKMRTLIFEAKDFENKAIIIRVLTDR